MIAGAALLQAGMNDYRRIRTLPRYSGLRPADTRRLHLESREWLQEKLSSDSARKTIVVTHHAPSAKSLSQKFGRDLMDAGYASDLEPLIAGSNAKLWIHGHTHSRADYRIVGTRVLSCCPIRAVTSPRP